LLGALGARFIPIGQTHRGNKGATIVLKRGYKQLIEDALERIHTLSVDEAQTKLDDPEVVFIDIREAKELEREGAIPGAFNAPRGMLEFWVDPESPYHKEVFAPGKHFILYCQSAWRSALATATLLDMGLTWVGHIEGGFSVWKQAEGPIVERQKKG
jgi:rhodanese-related sulfurtransferase